MEEFAKFTPCQGLVLEWVVAEAVVGVVVVIEVEIEVEAEAEAEVEVQVVAGVKVGSQLG